MLLNRLHIDNVLCNKNSVYDANKNLLKRRKKISRIDKYNVHLKFNVNQIDTQLNFLSSFHLLSCDYNQQMNVVKFLLRKKKHFH